MGVGDWFSDKGNTLLGKAPKAILFVQKRASSAADYTTTEGKNSINDSVSALRALAKAKKQKSVASRAGQTLTQGSQAMGVDDLDKLFTEDKAKAAEVGTAMAEKNFLKMEVQYNPNSIQFSTAAGRHKDFRAMGDSGAQQLVTIERKATTMMSVQLVFEDVNTQDAFIRENLNPNVGNLKDMAANLITKAAGGYSIKEKVEGLLSLLVSNRTRNVVFVWADMFFHGQLNQVDVNYTMFNKKGEPIKATVNLTIRQASGEKEFKTDKEYWEEAYKAAFKDRNMVGDLGENVADIGGNVSGNVAGAVGNLLS
ncbi:MAG: hypothetical protein IKO61_12360 [Lachnospiraceae bacterium]|nr:hypothetical protein [Lachnospiraceae bacterium]